MTGAPAEEELVAGVTVRPLTQADGPAMHALLVASRAHLDRWLRWSSTLETPDDVATFIAGFEARLAARDGFHCGIRVDGALAGGVVCWYIHRQNRNAEVGYWLAEAFIGRGLATRAARWAVDRLFRIERLHRVEMQCGVENRASRAVAERLGFRAEGVRRDSHWITDRFVDHVVYGMLEREWEARTDG
ncbi:MAG TPA: GNAT family protein [Gemmatimonadales bacterium]|nr:GNAT family protein [Gemmatimonadales bacterium]